MLPVCLPINPEWVGAAAAVLTTVAFVPQAAQAIRSRDLRGVSLSMYALFSSGVFLWLIYGLLRGSWPIIVANSITLILALTILVLKARSSPPPK